MKMKLPTIRFTPGVQCLHLALDQGKEVAAFLLSLKFVTKGVTDNKWSTMITLVVGA